MRLLAVGLAVAALAPGSVWAGERPVAVVVPSFVAPEALSIFAPEVARAVAGGLQQAGVDVVSSTSVHPPGVAPAVTVLGRIDNLAGERVRLSATIGAHTVQAEGPLEQVDGLAAELAHRLVALVPAGARHAPPHPAHADPHGPRRAAFGVAPLPPAVATAAPTPSAPPTPAAPPAAPTATASTPTPTATPAPTPPPEPAPTTATNPAPPSGAKPAEPVPDPATNIQDHGSSNTPTAPAERPAPEKPVPATRPVDPGYEALTPPRRRSDPHRVVLHTVRMPDGCATGGAATYALREAIERRSGMRVVAGGCGIAPPGGAVAEAQRAGAASVVMASFDWIRYEPMLAGVRPFGRVRMVVVRDGRATLVQTVDVSARTVPLPADANRVAYDLAAAAANQLAAALDAALAPGSDDPDPAPR